MPVPYQIPKELREIDFNGIDIYDFTLLLYSFENQSIFEPIRCHIPKEKYADFFVCIDGFDKISHLVEFEFIEYARVEVLRANGFTTASGYCHSKKHILDLNDWFP